MPPAFGYGHAALCSLRLNNCRIQVYYDRAASFPRRSSLCSQRGQSVGSLEKRGIAGHLEPAILILTDGVPTCSRLNALARWQTPVFADVQSRLEVGAPSK